MASRSFPAPSGDHSPSERPGQVVSREREDDADARLTWLGARPLGVVDFARGVSLGTGSTSRWCTATSG